MFDYSKTQRMTVESNEVFDFDLQVFDEIRKAYHRLEVGQNMNVVLDGIDSV